MKIIFFGSDDFAAEHLRHLLDAGHDVLACVTGPDKLQGRGMKLIFSPIKQMAIGHHIPCLQPPSLKEKAIVDTLRSYQADIFVVVAYGYLLTQEILDLPRMICINVHGSLLPKYRGAAPINWAILNGEKETGVTIQKMALKLDAGDIIARKIMKIDDDENAAQLRKRMAVVGADLLIEVLGLYNSGAFPLKRQDEASTSYAPKLTKEMGQIDWAKTARVINDQIRGLQDWPGAYTFFNGKMLKIIRAKATGQNIERSQRPGQVVKTEKGGFYVACADKTLLIQEVQPEAGKLMPAHSFTAGHKITQGYLLGK